MMLPVVLRSLLLFNIVNAGTQIPADQYKWAHAVNSNEKLKQTLQDQSLTAIEADIIFSSIQGQPVMGHPPLDDSDLTLANFLTAVLDYSGIIKLDFKSQKAFEESLPIIEEFITHMESPELLFLNADILKGPGRIEPKFQPAHEFIIQAQKVAPQSILSVGWTTNSVRECVYTKEMIDEMLLMLSKWAPNARVSFPIKATCVEKSWDVLQTLYQNPYYGLTLWYGGIMDDIEFIYSKLENSPVYKGRTFYDVFGFDPSKI